MCAGAGGHAGLLSPFALVKQIRFLGRAAHAGSLPQLGVNALNAAVIAMNAIAGRILDLTPRPKPNAERKLCHVSAATICGRPSRGPS